MRSITCGCGTGCSRAEHQSVRAADVSNLEPYFRFFLAGNVFFFISKTVLLKPGKANNELRFGKFGNDHIALDRLRFKTLLVFEISDGNVLENWKTIADSIGLTKQPRGACVVWFYGSPPNFSLTKSPVLKPASDRIS